VLLNMISERLYRMLVVGRKRSVAWRCNKVEQRAGAHSSQVEVVSGTVNRTW
jgi:hypothetical protein